MMTSSAEPELSSIPGQDEALCPLSISSLNFASLYEIRHRSTTRREFLIVLILGVHSATFDDNKLILTDC